MLTVAMPILKQNDLPGIDFVSEQPIQIECTPVMFPDGVAVQPESIIKAGFVTQRHQSNGSIERWDENRKQWAPSPNVDPKALFYKKDLWQGMIVAMGQKDKADEDKFSTNFNSMFPQYSVQCVFEARDSAQQAHLGISPSSARVQISPIGGKNQAGLYMKPKMEPSSATEIGMFLKDSGLVAERGRVSIKKDGSGFRIEIVCSESRIEILPNGEIVLTAKPGQPVRVAGDLEIAGTVKIGGAVSIAGTVSIDESVSIGKALNVIGKVTALNVP